MIDKNEIFEEVKDNIGLWCGAECAGTDLAAVAGMAITNKLHAVSVSPNAVAPLWAWLENTNVKILCRFYVDGKINDNLMSNLSSQISLSFHDGADGAIIFLRLRDMERFVSDLGCVRDDLFFNKILSVGLDINEINHDDWNDIFKWLQSVRADSLTLFLSRDAGDKSDFVGRVYALLNADMGDWNGVLHFVLGENYMRIDQVYRLTEKLRPNITQKILFLVNN